MEYKYRGRGVIGGAVIEGNWLTAKKSGAVIIGRNELDGQMVDIRSVVRIDEDGNKERIIFVKSDIDESHLEPIGAFQDVFKDEPSLLRRTLTVVEYAVPVLRMLSAYCRDQEARYMAKEANKLADELDALLNRESDKPEKR